MSYVKHSTSAERERGLVFSAPLRSETEILRMGGTINDSPIFNSREGCNFNGTTDYVNIPNSASLNITGNMSITMWVYNDVFSGANEWILDKHDQSGYGDSYEIYHNGRTIMCRIGGETTQAVGTLFKEKKWHFIACSWNGTNTTLYLNDYSVVGSGATPVSDSKDLVIGGGYSSDAIRHFDGKIKDLKIFNVALTTQEITDMYNNDTYRYEEKAVLNLPMTAAEHNPSNIGTNLLVDGTMEASDTSAYAVTGGATLSKETSDPQVGTKFLRCTGTGNGYFGAKQSILETGKTYRISGWYRGDGTVTARIDDLGGSEIVPPSTSSATWQSFSVDKTIATGGLFYLRSDASTTGHVDFDDIRVKLISSRTLDVSGNDNHATFGDGSTATTYPTKLSSKGYSFDGGDYLNLGTNLIYSGVNPYSIVVLFSTENNGGEQALYGEGNTGTDNPLLNIRVDNATNKIEIHLRSTGGANLINATKTNVDPADNTIHSMIFTDEAGDAKMYIDGILDTADFSYTPAATSLNTAAIGALIRAAISSEITGNIYTVQTYNKVLTPLQIHDLHIRLMKQINDI